MNLSKHGSTMRSYITLVLRCNVSLKTMFEVFTVLTQNANLQ